MSITWNEFHGHLCFYQRLLNLVNITFINWVKEHFVIWTDNVWAKCSKSRKWKGKHIALKMDVCVGCLVKLNSLWWYTTLLSYNFIEWMIRIITTVCLRCHCNIVQIRLFICISGMYKLSLYLLSVCIYVCTCICIQKGQKSKNELSFGICKWAVSVSLWILRF